MEQNMNSQSITIDELVASSRWPTELQRTSFEGEGFEGALADRINREGP